MCVCVGVGDEGLFYSPYIVCVCVCIFGLFIVPTLCVCLCVCLWDVLLIVLSVISSLEIILLMKREMVALS